MTSSRTNGRTALVAVLLFGSGCAALYQTIRVRELRLSFGSSMPEPVTDQTSERSRFWHCDRGANPKRGIRSRPSQQQTSNFSGRRSLAV